MTEWMREGESFVSGGSPWGDGAVATQGGGWMQEGATFAEPLEEPAPTRPYDEIDAFQDVTDMMELAAGPAPSQTAIVEQRLARTQNQLSFVEDAIRYGLETGDFDESYISRREELRNRLSRLNTQKNQLASGIPLTPIEGSGLEGEFETRWNDDGPQFLQDLDQIERGRVSEYVAEARENTSDYSPVRVGTQIASGVSSLLEYWGRRGLGDDEGARDVYLQNYATQRASAEKGGLVESYVANAGESITKALVAGKAGGFPGIVAAFFADTYMQSFESGKSRGLSEDESHGYAMASATTEAVITAAFSLAGAGGFESMVTKAVGRDGRQRAALEISSAMRREGAEAALEALRRNKNVIVSAAEPTLSRMVGSVYKKMPELFKQQVAEQLEEGLVSQLQYGRDLRTFGGEWSLEEAVNIGIDTAATTFLAVGAMRAADPKVREAIAKFAQEPSRANAKAVGLEYLGTKARREKVAEGVKAAAIREQLHAMVGRNLQSSEEADYLYGMLQARAESAGMTLDAYVAKNGLEFQVANWEEWSEANKDNKGVMEMLAEPAFENLPQDAKERLSGTAIVDDAGKPIPVYHGTQNPDFAGPARENNRRVAAAPKLIADWKDATAKWRSETKIDEIKQDYLDLRSVLRILGMESASERNKNYDLVKRVATRHGYADWWAMWQDHMSLNKKLREMEAQVKQIEATAPTVPAWVHDAAKSGVLLDESEDLDPNLFGANDEGWWAAGAYFTDSPKEASEYAGGGGVFFGFLAAKNPYNRDSKISDVERAVEEEYAKRTRDRQVPDPGWYARQRSEARRDVLQSLGYDGEVGTVDTHFGPVKNYVVFKKDQIIHAKRGKSASSPETLAEPAFDPTPEGDNDRLSRRRDDWAINAANSGIEDSDPIPRVNTRTTIRKTLDEVDFENPTSVREAIDRVADLEGQLAVQSELRREREANRGKARGPDAIRARLLDARRRGELREDAVEVADWLIRQNPEAFEDVGVSIRKQPPFGAGGHYNMASRIVTLFKTTDARSADTAAHELIHSLERYVPAKLSAEMNRGWLAEVKALLDKSMKDNDRDKYEIAVDLLRRAYGLDTLYTRVADNANAEFLKLAGADPSTMLDLRAADANLYHLTSPSEFWASQGAKLAASRSEAKTVFQQFKQWLRELITRIKSSLGTGADNAVIKSLNKILRGGTPELSGERNAYGDAVDTSVILNRFDLERQWLYRQQLDEQTEIDTLAEKTPGKKKKANRAQIQFLRSEGRTVITAFEQADFASLVHELGHLFRQDLAGADLNAAARWAGVKKGRWSRDAEEKFADAFLKWVAEGKGPTPAVTRFFEKFAGYLTGLFDAHRKARMEPLKLTPEITGVFGRLMGEGAVLAQQTQQEAVSRAPVDAPDQPEAIFQINTGTPTGAPATPQPTTLAEAEQDPVSLRFRDLANHEVEEARRKAVFEADVASGDYKRISRAAEDARALERIAANPAQERAFVMQMVESVERGVDVSINNVADQYVVHYMRRAAIDVGDRALTRRINRMLRASRTLDAQKMGWRDPVEKRAGNYAQFVKQTLDTALTLDPPEVADKRATARTPEEHAALDAEAEAWVQRLIEKLAAVGVDINDLEALANDPIGATKVIELIRKSRGELEANESWIFEYWRNSILSGPQTQIVNPVSTLAFAALVYGLERPTQAAVDAIYLRGKGKGVRFGEIGPAASGFLRGFFPALRNFGYAFVLTRPMLEESLGRLGETKLDTRPGAIPGWIGSVVRVPYKLLTAADDFTKTIIAHMEVGAVAYRVGKNRGMTGEDLGSFIESEVKNTNSASWDAAIDTAQQIAFQGEGGAVSTPIQNLIKAVQVNLPYGTGKFLVPFRKTPANIFEEGIRRMPIFGAVLDLVEGARAGKPFKLSGKNDEFYTGMFARQAVAIGLASALWALNDDDEPWITGAKDLMDRNDKRTQYGAIPAMSIRVPGVGWVSYARLEPIATYLSATVDAINGLKSGGSKQGAKDLAANAILQLTNKSYLDSVGDIIEGIIDFSQGESGGMYRWGTKFGASFVPNVWRQGVSPGYITQNRIWGKDEEFLKMALQRTAEQARLIEPYPLIDPWGREVPFSGQVSDFWLRLLNPFRIADEDRITQMDWAVRAWNRQNPKDKTSWATPDYFFRRNGETHYLTTAEYVEYSKRAGQYALERAEKINVNVEKPTKAQMTAIANALAAGRRRARNELMPQWLDRIRSEGELRSNEQPPTPAR